MDKNPLQFLILPDSGGGCHVRLTDVKNHETIYWTEHYTDIRAARRAIVLAKRNVTKALVLDLRAALLARLRRAS